MVVIRREDVARRYFKGESLRSIGEAHGVSHTSIWKDLEILRGQWRESREKALDVHVDEQLAKLNEVEKQAWEGWYRSMVPAEVTYAEQGQRGGKAWKRTTGQAGDTSYLDLVLRCIERRCKLLGIDAPEKSIVTGTVLIQEYPSGWGEPTIIDVSGSNGHSNGN